MVLTLFIKEQQYTCNHVILTSLQQPDVLTTHICVLGYVLN